jgi:tetratricopeptide (TPR) repeat protein
MTIHRDLDDLERRGIEPAAADEIIHRCGGLPLALAIVAARVVTHPDFPLEAVARDLRGSERDLDGFDGGDSATDLRAVFSWSYHALTAPAARLFRLLALHPGPDLSTPAAASLAGIPVRQARQVLTALTRAHLVTAHAPGRFRFHDLIRTHATELVDSVDSAEQRHAATRRMVDHYLHTAHAAAVLLDPHRSVVTPDPPLPGVTPEEFPNHKRAMAWLTTEHLVLLAITGSADRAELDTQAWQIACAVGGFLHRRGHHHHLADNQQIALRAAQRLADPAMQARAHRGIAAASFRLARLDNAHTHLQRALELSDERDDPRGTAYTHLSFGAVEAQGHHYREALDHARKALDLFDTHGDRTGQARALNLIGWQHIHLGEHHQAVTACRQALVLLEEIDDRHSQGMTWDSIGYAYHQLGDHQQAIACYQQALALLRDAGGRLIEAETLGRLGDTYHAVESHDDARSVWRHALTILDELGHPEADSVRAKLQDQASR